MTSWELFDILLEQVQIVSTPGSGFGPHGEGYLRLTAFGSRENTIRAVERIKNIKNSNRIINIEFIPYRKLIPIETKRPIVHLH